MFSFSSRAEISIELNIDDDELETNIEAYLSAIPESQRYLSPAFDSRLKSEVSAALQALGYYHPEITIETDKTSDEDAEIRITVVPGMSVILKQVDVKLSGDAATDIEFEELLADKPTVGDRLNHKKYDDFKSSLSNLALKRGYFDAKFSESKLAVSPSRNLAFVTLHFDSGKRYRFGEVNYTDQQIQLDRIRSIEPFKQGDYYLVNELGKFNQSLQDTGWYSSVVVEADFKGAEDAVIPVNVTLEPSARNQFETGIGFVTDTGPRLKLNWNKPWYNSRGHSIRNNFSMSAKTYEQSITYKVPLSDVTREFFELSSEFIRETQGDADTKSVALKASRHWKYDKGWQRALSIRWLYEEFEEVNDDKNTNLLLPGIEFNRLRSRGGAMPYWGDRQSLNIEGAETFLQSDIDLLRITGRTTWIRTYFDNHRLLTRIDGGTLLTSEFERVPTSLRFFAGGDTSIRGYGYRDISPKQEGKLIGGANFATGSVEYQYRLTDDWWLATFYDVGDAWTNDLKWKRGGGVGIRWGSPVGPVHLDFAKGFDVEGDNRDKFRIHFSVGPQL
ncbi:autotransporter assembly complex protein TamA [Veronia pacifica]|uniref:Translocation and assembly module subunit TamA n=2 Tax=Veronia pacifica TaxID=1080227 RepID=A0A1C3EPY5_9GAMM|nr:hypothetical protein A8L45_03820 [Veronia pacifica]